MQHVMRLLDSAKSFVTAMRASGAAGRGFRLRDSGDMRGALTQARLGLAMLSKPYVRRANPSEASALVSLTVLAEESAIQLLEQGASVTDLLDAIAAIKRIGGHGESHLRASLSFLEARFAATYSAPSAKPFSAADGVASR